MGSLSLRVPPGWACRVPELVAASPFKPKSRLEAENAALRRQLVILQRKKRGRVHLTNGDRLFLVTLYRWFPSVLKTIAIIRPATLLRCPPPAFPRYWPVHIPPPRCPP